MALSPFLTPTLTNEEFNEMYLCCHEVNVSRTDFCQRVAELILAKRKQIATENAQLYRKRGNIQLDQNIGETTMLMSERIDLSDWDEWDR